MIIELILVFPLIFSLILFLIKSKKLNNFALILYSIFLLIASFTLYLNLNNPTYNYFQVYFKVDSLNILFLLILSIIFSGVTIYNYYFMKDHKINKNEHSYFTIGIILFVFSMTGTILSTNLGLSWVFIEATTLASAYLIYFNKTKQALEATWKYVFICSIGISLAFVGIILLTIGTESNNSLFFSDLYNNTNQISAFWLKLSFVFMLIGFGTKMGLAPLHTWLPDAHAEAPSPISALLSATLLNSAFLIILRFYKLMEISNLEQYAKFLLLTMGLLSLFITAVYFFNIKYYKRMLAYSSIENMGIIAIGIAIGGVGIYAAMLHLLVHSLLKASFFLTSGNIIKLFNTKKIDEVSGIIKVNKTTGWLWVICFIGIAGFPPFPLFISELLILTEMFKNNQIVLAIVFLIFLTIIIYGLSKAIIKMSFGNPNIVQLETNTPFNHDQLLIKKLNLGMYLPQILFITASLILGIYIPYHVNELLQNAAFAISLI